MGDSYRPSRGRERPRNSYDNYVPPPPPPPYDSYDSYAPPPPPPPPLPRGADDRGHYYRRPSPPPLDYDGTMRSFGEARGRDRRSDFDFAPRNLPSYPSGKGSYRPLPDDYAARRRQHARERDRRDGPGRGPRRDQDYRRQGGRQGWPFRKPGTSERALLRFERGQTPPQLEGMNGGEGNAKYLDFDDLSDVEDQDMDESTDEDAEDEPAEQPVKPKWSNPEVYNALPPPDESQRQKKDMVKLIRKARIPINEESKEAEKPNLAAGGDFISLNFGDSDEEEEELIKPGVPGAPKGPAADRKVVPTQSNSMPQPIPSRQAAQELELIDLTGSTESVASRLLSLKRKRVMENDDEDLLSGYIRPPSKSLKRGQKPTGSLVPEWQLHGVPPAIRNKKSIPWQNTATRGFSLPNARLHHEIVDFYHFVQPKNYEKAIREDLLRRLETFMRRAEPRMDCAVQCFGSFALGIYLPDADMDVAIISREYRNKGMKVLCQSSNKMHRLANRMQMEGLADEYEVIPRAKVPIIKIIDRQTSLKVDICFENTSGINAISTFENWKAKFPAMPILVTVIKQFLLMRGLNDVAVGGLGGFAVTCLVTSLLHHLPRVQTGELKPEEHLGEMLIEFLDFYGSRFDCANTAIRTNPPSLVPKRSIMQGGLIAKAKEERLMVIDPNNQENDISGGTSEIDRIFLKFRQAKAEILNAMEKSRLSARISLVDWMLGGNYDSFLWYRRKLRDVYEMKFGPVPVEDPTIP